MAVYAATVTLDTPRPGRLGNTSMGVISGSCHITNYNSTAVAIAAITKAFLPGGKLTVVPNGISSAGFIMAWNAAASAFKAYGTAGADITVGAGSITADPPTLVVASGTAATHPVGMSTVGGSHFVSDAGYSVSGSGGGWTAGAITDTRTLSTAAGAIAEASNDQDVGTFTFLAIGQLG
jgi:hypothetical protein